MTEPLRIDDVDDGYYAGDRVDPANPTREEDDQGLLHMSPWVLWGLLVPSLAIAVPVVLYYAPESWSVTRKVLAGGLAGVLAHYCLFINRILVAKW